MANFFSPTRPKGAPNKSSAFVQFPFSDSSTWNLIRVHLESLTVSISTLVPAEPIFPALVASTISEYNRPSCNYAVLHAYLGNAGGDADTPDTLLHLIKTGLSVQSLFQRPLPLLQTGTNATVVLSKAQIHSILANAFLCTFPNRPEKYPGINLTKLFDDTPHSKTFPCKLEKLKCIFNYFAQMKHRPARSLAEQITIERRCLLAAEIPDWKSSKKLLAPFDVRKGKIEDAGQEYLLVDFANKYVGGGVLGSGAVQEEILFAIYPELIAARLVAQRLDDNEVLFVSNVERFSNYKEYGYSFKFNGPHSHNARSELVAMDALDFSADSRTQYKMKKVRRELNKCFCAFLPRTGSLTRSIASGNWGCGAFKGDPQLKFLLQWIAASQANNHLTLFSGSLNAEVEVFGKYLLGQSATVGQLVRVLEDCCNERAESSHSSSRSIFECVRHKFDASRGRSRSQNHAHRSRSRSPRNFSSHGRSSRPNSPKLHRTHSNTNSTNHHDREDAGNAGIGHRARSNSGSFRGQRQRQTQEHGGHYTDMNHQTGIGRGGGGAGRRHQPTSCPCNII